jgi:hypothetical protein
MSINYFPFESKSGFKSPNFTVDHLGNVVIDGSLTVDNLNLSPAATGSINNVDIGLTIPGQAAFTELSVLNDIIIDPQNIGSIDNVTIGANTPLSGNFTNLSASLAVNLTPTNGGSIENINIGAVGPGTGNFTIVTLTESATQPNQVITKGYVDSRVPAIAIALGA